MPQSIWHQCLEVLRDEFPAQQFNTWLRPLQPQLDEGNLVLFAPNRFVMDWVNQKYLRRIEEVIKDLEGGQAPRVNMKVGSASRPA
ncbi:MAG: DnaA N-terminal domain-containing protein, partial [Marinobacter sp.]